VNIVVKLKSVGKRKPVLDDMPYSLPEGISTLRQLIEAIVCQEVQDFNQRAGEQVIQTFLTENEINDLNAVGKVGFGCSYSDRKADLGKAIATALLGFEDGLYKVLVNESDIAELDAQLALQEGDRLTFIRLTFLAGRYF